MTYKEGKLPNECPKCNKTNLVRGSENWEAEDFSTTTITCSDCGSMFTEIKKIVTVKTETLYNWEEY